MAKALKHKTGLLISELQELQGCWATANMRILDLGILISEGSTEPSSPK